MTLRQRITEAFPDQAERVFAIITGRVSPFTVDETERWRQQCYHDPRPEAPETIMHAINGVLGGYGAEAIWGDDSQCPVAEYVNFGDTYDTTILYDYRAERFRVMSWGDWVEKYGERYGVQ